MFLWIDKKTQNIPLNSFCWKIDTTRTAESRNRYFGAEIISEFELGSQKEISRTTQLVSNRPENYFPAQQICFYGWIKKLRTFRSTVLAGKLTQRGPWSPEIGILMLKSSSNVV